MFLMRNLPLNINGNENHVNLQYTYYLGDSWQECGVAEVNAYLSSLGFSTPNEVVKFLSAYNVFEHFSEDGWLQRYISNSERQEVLKGRNPKAQKQNIFPPTIINSAPIFELKSSYEDFFQCLFSWITRNHSPVERADYIKYWESRTNPPNNRYAIQTATAPCLKSFKELVDNFLKELRTPKKLLPQWLANLPQTVREGMVDVVHSLRNNLASKVLTKANWDYISGIAVTGGIGAGEFASVSIGGSNFAVFDKAKSDKIYPLMTLGGTVGVGVGPSLPISVTIDPEEFPSRGTIYNGFTGPIQGIHSFLGAYVAISETLTFTILNQNSSLMFIAPNYKLPVVALSGADMVALFASVIPASTAILLLDGQGIEVGIGTAKQISVGYVGPGKAKK